MTSHSLRNKIITGRDRAGKREAVLGAFSEKQHGHLEPPVKQKHTFRSIKHDFEICTSYMQSAFERNFPRFSSTYVFVISQLKNNSGHMDDYLVTLLESSIELVKNEHFELIESLEGEEVDIDYPLKRKGEADIYGKPTRLYLDLILETDRYIQTLEACVILGYKRRDEFAGLAQDWKEFVERTKSRFEGVVRKIGLTAKKLNTDWHEYLLEQMKFIEENQSSLQSKKKRPSKKTVQPITIEKKSPAQQEDIEIFK